MSRHEIKKFSSVNILIAFVSIYQLYVNVTLLLEIDLIRINDSKIVSTHNVAYLKASLPSLAFLKKTGKTSFSCFDD